MKTKILLGAVIFIIFSVIGAYYFLNNKPMTVNDTETVSEKQLDSQGLEWTDDLPGLNGYVNFNTALSHCDELSSVGGLKPNTAWRLPTKNELLQLYKEVQNDNSTKLSSIGYWSSENYNNDTKMENILSIFNIL